jgi:serine/threonine-protein kinase RsbW
MAPRDDLVVRLAFSSALPMTDFVQVVGDHIARRMGFNDEAVHWVGVAVRECVVNAITHGNHDDAARQVFVDFEVRPDRDSPELQIRVRDQGEGFNPDELADPLAPENLLKTSGRGIFLIRSFMDDVRLRRASEGGMEVVMTKRVEPAGTGAVGT